MTSLQDVKTRLAKLERGSLAILTICTACLISTAQDVTIKWISADYPFPEMQTIRCGAALTLVGFFALRTGGWRSLLMPGLSRVILRGSLLSFASVLFYLTAVAMPYPDAVAMYFTMPLIVVALASLFGKERAPLYRWFAVGVAFLGVLLILRPGSALFEPAALLGLGCALCYALGNLLTRRLSGAHGAAPLAFWQNAMYLALALVLSGLFGSGAFHVTTHASLDYLTRGWLWPAPGDLLLISLLGASTSLLFYLFTQAYRLAASSLVAPFEYSAMVWALLFSFGVWRQWPDVMSLLGIALIVGAGLCLFARER